MPSMNPSGTPQSVLESKRRLMREACDLKANPLCNCNAAPLEDNLYKWHANIACDKWPDTWFHFEFLFPKDYPNRPPKIKNCTFLDHPNVIKGQVCLDMLSSDSTDAPWRVWSSNCTVSSVLIQLQQFLFEVDLPGLWGDKRAAREAAAFRCPHCDHAPGRPWPSLSKTDLSWELSGECRALYLLERNARVRVGPSKNSLPICEIEAGTKLLVKEVRGNRAKVVLKSCGRDLVPECKNFVTGWVSKVTDLGPLLTKVQDCQIGLYSTKKRCQLYHSQEVFRDWRLLPAGKIDEGKELEVVDVLHFHSVLYGVLKSPPRLVEMNHLSFIRAFEIPLAARAEEAAMQAKRRRRKKKKKNRSTSRTPSSSISSRHSCRSSSFSSERPQQKKKKRRKANKDLTPREIRRRNYWRTMQAAARQAAKVASAPKKSRKKQAAVQPNTYHPTVMLYCPIPSPNMPHSSPSLTPCPSLTPFPQMNFANAQLLLQGMPSPSPSPAFPMHPMMMDPLVIPGQSPVPGETHPSQF